MFNDNKAILKKNNISYLNSEYKHEIKRFIRNHKKSNKIIVSSENLIEYMFRLNDASFLDSQIKELVRYAKNITFICFVKRQDFYYESVYLQYIKQGRSYSFDHFLRKYSVYNLNWYNIAKAMKRYCKNVKIIPIENYKIGSDQYISLVHEIFDLNFKLSSLKTTELTNKTYSLQSFKKAIKYNSKHNDRESKKNYRTMLEKEDAKKGKYEKPTFFTASQRKFIRKFYKNGNTKLFKEFIRTDLIY